MTKAAGQLMRYATVGIISNIIGFLLYLALTYAGMEHKLAMTLLYGVGVAQTFVFNKRWAFGYQGMSHTAFLRYVIAYVLGYALNFVMLWLAVDQFRLPHQWVQAVAIVIVASSLFVLHRYWVFAPAARSRTP